MMPGDRFPVRRMMVAVVIVAIGLGLSRWMQRRAANFRYLAAYHTEAWLAFLPYPVSHPPARATCHWDLAGKYNYAARRPWLPVAPDPPEPE
jgi:hypothetical protein